MSEHWVRVGREVVDAGEIAAIVPHDDVVGKCDGHDPIYQSIVHMVGGAEIPSVHDPLMKAAILAERGIILTVSAADGVVINTAVTVLAPLPPIPVPEELQGMMPRTQVSWAGCHDAIALRARVEDLKPQGADGARMSTKPLPAAITKWLEGRLDI